LDNPDSIARDMPERDCDENIDGWKKVINTEKKNWPQNVPIKTKPLIQ